MQAHVLAYHRNEETVALGWPTGLVQVARVDASDGSPTEMVAQCFAHKREIKFLAWADDERLISVDESGRVVLSDASTGAVQEQLSVGGEYLSAALSPSRRALFIFGHNTDHDTNTYALDLESFRLIYGPEAKALSVTSQVLALSDQRAAYFYLHETDVEDDESWDEDEKVDDALCIVDFDEGLIDTKVLEGGPGSTVGDPGALAINASATLGVRCAWGAPLSICTVDDAEFLEIKLETFDPQTFESKRMLVTAGIPVDGDDEELRELLGQHRGVEEYRDKLDELFRNITSLAVTDDGRHVWVGLRGGLLRRLCADSGERGPMIKHGGEPPRDTNTLDEVFAHNIRNNKTLAVSPSGRFLAFANPNDFFSAEQIDFDSSELHALPQRAAKTAGGATERPSKLVFVDGGAKLVVGCAGGQVFLVDPRSGEMLFETEVPYGDHLADASLSPDGEELILAYAGRESLRVRLGGDEPEIVELPLPPHTIFAEHLTANLVALGHSNGAVVALEDNTLHAFRQQDDEDEDEDFDDEDFDDEDFDDEDFDDEDEDEGGEDEGGEDEGGEDDENPFASCPFSTKNPEGVQPLELMANYEGVFVYNDYFEQRYDVRGVARGRLDGKDVVLVLDENESIDVYSVDAERIRHVFSADPGRADRLSAGGAMVATTHGDKGQVRLSKLTAEGLREQRRFDDRGLRLVGVLADGQRALLFNEESGLISALDLESYAEESLLRYEGPAIAAATFDPRSGLLALTEANGNVQLVDALARELRGNLCVKGSGEERRLELGGTPLGRLEATSGKLERSYETVAESQRRDEEHAQVMDYFRHGPRDGDLKAAAKRLDKATGAVKALMEKDDYDREAGIALLHPILSDYVEGDYHSVGGENRYKQSLGAAFAQRGVFHRRQGRLDAAEADFRRAIAYHHYLAHNDLTELLCYDRGDLPRALAHIDDLLRDREGKNGVRIRRSMPIYKALIRGCVLQGNAAQAERLLQLVIEGLVPFIGKDDLDQEYRPEALSEALGALVEECEGQESSLAKSLLDRFLGALESLPEAAKKDEAEVQRLDAAISRATFFVRNGRQERAATMLDDLLAPWQRDTPMTAHGFQRSTVERNRLGELFALRGKLRRDLGQRAGALADLEQAVAFRRVGELRNAVETALELGDAPRAAAHIETFTLSPFYWASKWWAPFTRFEYAYLLTLGELASTGDDASALDDGLAPVVERYGDEAKAVAEALESLAESLPGELEGPAKRAAARWRA